MDYLQIIGKDIKSNSKSYIELKVTRDLDGGEINIPVHVIAGSQKGPTLALFSTVHGGEWVPIEVLRRIVQKIELTELAGTLIVVPVANPIAFGNYLNRVIRDESDNADLNRTFPGQYTWITEQISSKLAKEVLKNIDCLIDFHWGMWGCTFGAVYYGADYPDVEVNRKTEAVAKAFGYPCMIRGKVMAVFPGPKSTRGYVGGVLGKPCFSVEIGGAGFDQALEERWIDVNIKGVENVMKHLKMLKGVPQVPEKYLICEKRWRVNPSIGGMLIPKLPVDSLMREVKKGELLGQVVSPYSFEVLEELRSPGNGILMTSARMYPVRPGDWAFAVIDTEDKGTQWVTRHDRHSPRG